jgi:hypothetical protein
MVRKRVSIVIVGGVAAVSACFGDGPVPEAPSQATVLFSSSPSQNCSSGTYLGPVAFGSDRGYVSFLQYQPVGNCGGGGGGPSTAPQAVFGFGLADGTLSMLGSAGQTYAGAHVQLAALGSGYAAAYNDPSGPSGPSMMVVVDPGHAGYGLNMGTDVPLGLAEAGGNLYVATASSSNTTGGRDLEDPMFPNGGDGSVTAGKGTIWKVGGGQVRTWTPGCGGLDRCVVGGGSALVYVEHPPTGAEQWQITRLDLGSGSPVVSTVASQMTDADLPFGLDTDGRYIAWSTTQSCAFQSSSPNQRCTISDCTVSVFDTTMPMAAPETLLATTRFGCVDAKLANGYVYFSIVALYADNNSMFGRGIGRVSIADRTVETIDLGIRGPYAGPRRIFPIGDQLFLVDPLVMARIDDSALAGKLDVVP